MPDDVSSLLAVAQRDGVLSRDEVRHLGYQLLVAGHETTTSLIGLMLLPAARATRADGPAARRSRRCCPHAIEEALRFDSPVQGLFRTNASECTVAGETLPPRTQGAAAVRLGQP